ncbi:MAG TPA: HD domain-containing phosphohydrolase, partial [Solirubrobacteraceae bacterium]|nr:HD domain-containing phosphohydrolase [Solirubrobacteraceae bacterium]
MPEIAKPTKFVVAAAAFAVLYLALAPLGVWTADGLYSLVVLGAMTMCVKVLLAPGAAHRRFWLPFAPGVILMGAGDLLWTAFELLGADPTPSPADACYVVGELLIVFALLRGSRTWSRLRSVRTLIDASVLAAAALTIGGSLIVAPQLGGELDTTVLLALTYSGLGVIAVVPALILCLGPRRPPLPILLVAAGVVSSTLGDGLYAWLEARDAYVSGHPVDLFWMVEYGLYAAAAAVAIRSPRRPPVTPAEGDAGLVPLLGGVAALVGFWLLEDRPLWVGVVLASALAAMAVRLLITSRDHRRIVRELEAALAERERASVTDALTGLRNRAAIEEALRAHHGPLGVVTLELETAALSFADRDDVVLAAAGRIRALAGAGAVLGRTGASELTLLVGNPAATHATAERMRAAIAGEPFPAGAVGASAGVAWAPDHGASGEALLRAAEQARALARELGGNQVRAHGDTVDRALLEHVADDVDLRRGCEGHSRAVGRWAAAVAAQLGLEATARHRCELAGRLHDVGLVSAPDALLRRPQFTTRDDLVRLEEHPLAATALTPAVERVLGSVAPGIARHHDLLDAAPPLEARIVAVCNAWASLREGRAGRVPLGVEAARAQLQTRSGTAYDPDVVRAFLQLELTGEVGRNEASDLRPARGHVAADEILAATAAAADEPATPGVAA